VTTVQEKRRTEREAAGRRAVSAALDVAVRAATSLALRITTNPMTEAALGGLISVVKGDARVAVTCAIAGWSDLMASVREAMTSADRMLSPLKDLHRAALQRVEAQAAAEVARAAAASHRKTMEATTAVAVRQAKARLDSARTVANARSDESKAESEVERAVAEVAARWSADVRSAWREGRGPAVREAKAMGVAGARIAELVGAGDSVETASTYKAHARTSIERMGEAHRQKLVDKSEAERKKADEAAKEAARRKRELRDAAEATRQQGERREAEREPRRRRPRASHHPLISLSMPGGFPGFGGGGFGGGFGGGGFGGGPVVGGGGFGGGPSMGGRGAPMGWN